MKKLLLTGLTLLMTAAAYAQITTLPYTQGFETTFVTGTSASATNPTIQLVTDWYGNTVNSSATATRIYRDTVNMRTGNGSLGMVPTSTFEGLIFVRADMSGKTALKADFYAKTIKNGSGADTRSALLFMSTSIDGGTTFSAETLIGDSTVFANSATTYNAYSYNFPINTYNQSNVVLKIRVIRGSSTGMGGQAAKLIVDDFVISETANDFTPPTVKAILFDTPTQLRVVYSEAMSSSAENTANYSGIANLSTATRVATNDTVILTYTSAIAEGVFHTLTIDNVQDLAANNITAPYVYNLIYNHTQPDLVITEIMYDDPSTGASADSLEFIEIYNRGTSDAILGGLKITKGVSYTFPTDTLAAGGFYLLAKNATASTTFYSETFTQWTSGTLNNSGETIELLNTKNELIDSVQYKGTSNGPWPSIAANAGKSIEINDVALNNNVGTNWKAAIDSMGVLINTVRATPGYLSAVTVNTDTIKPYITDAQLINGTTLRIVYSEAVNTTASNVGNYTGISGLTTVTHNSIFTADTVILNYTTPFADGITKTLTVAGVQDLAGNTMAAPYTFTFIHNEFVSQLVITEIMYDTQAGDTLQFVEIYNWGTPPIQLGGLKLTGSINYTFPETVLPTNGYLLMAKNNAAANAFYSQTFTQWTSGTLSNATNSIVIVNSVGTVIDSVSYNNAATAPWPTVNGKSIELTDISTDNNQGINWTDCDTIAGTAGATTIYASPGKQYTVSKTKTVFENQNQYIVYPNPFENMLTIENTDGKGQLAKIFDMSGKEVYSTNSVATLNMSKLSKGTYTLLIFDKEGRQLMSQKVIKN